MGLKEFKNIHEMLHETVKKRTTATAYGWFSAEGKKETVSWSEHYENVKKAAKSLIALGVGHGDKVNILSYTCYPWILMDHANTACGAVSVGIYQSNLPKDCKYIINHSDAVIVFVENQAQLDKILEIRSGVPNIKKVVIFKDAPSSNDDWIISFDAFMKLGDNVSDADFIKRANAVTPNDLAGLVYTSGTTGVPKGAMLTHDNFCFTAQSIEISLDVLPTDQCFLFLPLAHVFARICNMACTLSGVQVDMARGIDTIVEDIKMCQPTWFPSVPRIYEKVYSKVLSGAEAKGGVALKLFRWSVSIGEQVSNRKQKGQPIPALLKFKYKLADKLVFSKIKAALGGKLRWCISGAAPINPDICRFFHAAGILILEGIGMTENTSFSHVNRSDNYRFGWVGLPGPDIEARIAEDGEFQTRGRNSMKGYYKMPKESAATFTEDGWLCTGDLGEIDSLGFLKITGRKKDLIITAGGKNVAPAHIEGVLGTIKYLNQVCVIGDNRKYLTALVTLDLENVVDFARGQNITYSKPDDLITHEQVVSLIDNEIQSRNTEFASYETIKKVSIVPEFTIENGLLTPTMKVKKNVVIKLYDTKINAMYPNT